MPIVPPGPPVIPSQQPGGTCSFKGLDIISQAMIEIGVLDPNEPPTASEGAQGLAKLNRMLDAWNADERYVYAVQFLTFTLTPNLQPHTIGPSGTFVVNQRPERLEGANIILNANTPSATRQPVDVRDKDWWATKRAFNISNTFPTDVYYEPDWNNGSLFLWPIPTIAYPLELELWTILNQLQLNSSFCMPPGYMDAVVYSLAEALAPSFQAPWTPNLETLRRKAIDRIWAPNLAAPRMSTRDAGIPTERGPRPTFNYLTGQNR